ncbi:MAG: hypothetical protein RLZZ447_846 [Verrucomicrobiota bacterium]
MRPRSLQRLLAGASWRLACGTMAAFFWLGNTRGYAAQPNHDGPRVALLGDAAGDQETFGLLTTSLAPLALVASEEEAEVAVVLRGPGTLRSASAAALARFLARPGALVLLSAEPNSWPGGTAELSALVGATPGETLALGDAPLVLSEYGHPITSGIAEPAAPLPLRLWSGFAADTFVLQEATAGEATAPLAWIRKGAARRLVHLAAVTPESLREAPVRRLVTQAVWWAAGRLVPGATPSAQRTVMPDAHPGSFALTFPEGVGVNLDPVRGGINFLWAGEFADLRPRWLTKQGAPARLDGPVWYRESTEPVWQTAAGGPAATWRFRGHATRAGAPEFDYEVAGRLVRERVAARPDGRGLIRQFTVGPGQQPLWLRLAPQAGVRIEVTGARREGEHAGFTAEAGGEFTVRLLRMDGEVVR